MEIDDLRAAMRSDMEGLLCQLFPTRPVIRLGDELRVGNRGALSVRPKQGVWYCHESGCGGDEFDLIRHAMCCDFKSALSWARNVYSSGVQHVSKPVSRIIKRCDGRDIAKRRVKARTIWDGCHPAQNTLAERYLRERRGITLTLLPEDICFHPSLYNYTLGANAPALVAMIRDKGGELIAVQAVFLTADANKIAGDGITAKMIWGTASGGSIHLADPAEKLALCEGLEDGLTIRQSLPEWPVWVCCGTSGLLAVEIPESVAEVLICADRDEAGMRAAHQKAERLLAAGLVVKIIMPRSAKDFNQEMREMAV